MKKCIWKGEELPLEMFLNKCRKSGLPDIWYEDVFDLMYCDSSIHHPVFMYSPLVFGKGLILAETASCYCVE